MALMLMIAFGFLAIGRFVGISFWIVLGGAAVVAAIDAFYETTKTDNLFEADQVFLVNVALVLALNICAVSIGRAFRKRQVASS